MNNFELYTANMISEFHSFSGEDVNVPSVEMKLLFLYAYYNFFHADASKYSDLLGGLVSGRDLGHHSVAAIYIDEESDDEDVVAIIPFFSEEKKIDSSACLKWCIDAEKVLLDKYFNKASNEKHSVLNRLEEVSEKHIIIKLITNHVPKTQQVENEIRNTIEHGYKPQNANITYEIVFGQQIESDILEIENPREYVNSAIVEMESKNSYFKFGKEESIVVNISAKSIQEIYKQYAYRGLFAQNLRYYIKNAKIDGNIVSSIKDNPRDFWYLNNGLILICDDYRIYNNRITLINFSVVNGGQTTKLIGETEFNDDFYVVCKIIKNRFEDSESRIEFIAKVAEASNTQKPIKTKDLIANRIEQRKLKQQLLSAGIYCQIKRGEKVNKKQFPQPWQNTTNEELGQFLLSFMYQMPGSARGAKASISGDENRYDLLFGKEYHSDFLVDILKLKVPYKKWETHVKKRGAENDSLKIGLVGNGRFFILSIIGILAKIYIRPELLKEMWESETTEDCLEMISQADIHHHLFKPIINDADQMFELFDFCYKKFYRPAYEFKKGDSATNNFSNYTKSNANYNTTVLREIKNYFRAQMTEEDRAFLERFFHIPDESERQRNEEMLDKYKNVVQAKTGEMIDNEVAKLIKAELNAYRKMIQKKQKLKANKIFGSGAVNRISQKAPKTLEELAALSCLDKWQLEHFGRDIVEVVNKATNNP